MPEIPFQEVGTVAPKKKAAGGLFGKKDQGAGPDVSNALVQVNEIARRLKVLESRYTDLTRKTQVTEKNMITERKRFSTELKTIDLDILELKRTLHDMSTKLDMVVGELENFAGKEDIAVVKKYVELWEPIRFITREEVDKIVKEAMQEKGK